MADELRDRITNTFQKRIAQPADAAASHSDVAGNDGTEVG